MTRVRRTPGTPRRFHLRHDQREHAIRTLTQARSVYERLAVNFPIFPQATTPLALFLSTCPEKSLRDPAWAVQIARRAGAWDFDQTGFADGARGVALYRQGQYQDALTSLERASRWHNGFDRPEERFFRAMVLWKLGDKEAARHDYAGAVRLMSLAIDRWSELEPIRNEAAIELKLK